MNLYCLGLNHRTAPVEIREKYWFSDEEVRSVLPKLQSEKMSECALVSTCNRTELYVVSQSPVNEREILNILSTARNVNGLAREEYFYSLHALNAVKHLFNVATGIDSMVLGDVQILNQVKVALALAQELHGAGAVLNRLFETALRVGKRARTETGVGEGAVSAGYAAAELASKVFSDLKERTALLVGAGETGALTAKHLVGNRLGRLLIANRTRERAETLAKELGGVVLDFESFRERLPEADIIISSVGAPGYILTESDFGGSIKARGKRPLVVIDLGVPRNIDPEACRIENVFFHDIDSLNSMVDKNLSRRQAEIPRVQEIVRDEVAQFHGWLKSLQLNSTIHDLRDQFEHIRREELEKHSRHFDSEVQEELAILTKRIVNKILHTPMVNLRTAAADSDTRTLPYEIKMLRSIFGLGSNRQD